ncbi:ACP S-malonyltransferase [bacterium]|jgi:[acyl-carrier-protein] S-malonyltransferase|nr:ACP S-malonyltransferase [bacterium]
MKKIAFVFPGQGTQYVGMGADFYKNEKKAQEVYLEAERLSGQPIRKLCFQGPEESLLSTIIQQPTIHTTEVALLRSLQAREIYPDVCAGFSLGEYAALVCAGIMDFQDSLNLVIKRGPLIQAEVAVGVGKMALIIGLDKTKVMDIVEEAQKEALVEISNYNSPKQLIISGYKVAVDKAIDLAFKAGATKIFPLKVSAPFHTSLLKNAGTNLAKELKDVQLKPPVCTFIPNVTAKSLSNEDVKDLLDKHIWYPVRWEESVSEMLKQGVELIVEVGPGRSLSRYNQEIIESLNGKAQTFSVQNYEDILELEKIIKGEQGK